MISICLTYFRSLTLANLDAALYSVQQQQDLSKVDEIVIVDNNSTDDEIAILDVVESFGFPVPNRVLSFKHGDSSRTHAWSTNAAVRNTSAPWVLFTRADYLLSFDFIRKLSAQMGRGEFITSNGCHLAETIDACEQTSWRTSGPQIFRGAEFDYTSIDSGVWLGTRAAFEAAGGLDERLSAWGHAQTEFQYRLWRQGAKFVRVPEVLFWHPFHGGPRDIELAHAQLKANGADLKAMWDRYEGANPYASV